MKKLLFSFYSLAICSMLAIAQKDCKITYISNEGFLIETSGKKVLIDGLFDTIDGNWCDSPSKEMVQLMKTGSSPFDQLDIIAVTHQHRDHFNEKLVVNCLLNNPDCKLICPDQVNVLLQKNPLYCRLYSQIIPVTPQKYCDTTLLVSDIPVRVLRLEHSHYLLTDSISGEKVNKHQQIENLGFVMDIKGTKIYHCGDTNPLNEKEYTSFRLNKEELDIAFIERLFYSKGPKGIEILNKYINPKHIILMHLNPANKEIFSTHLKDQKNVKIFKDRMESYTYNKSHF